MAFNEARYHSNIELCISYTIQAIYVLGRSVFEKETQANKTEAKISEKFPKNSMEIST